MVAASKLLDHIKHENCKGFLHSGTCRQQFTKSVLGGFKSNASYFAPVILMSLLIKINKLNRERLHNTLKYYMFTVLTGTSLCISISTIICIFRNLLGHFDPNCFVFLPTTIGGIIPIFAYHKTWNLYKTSIFQIFLESRILKQRNIFTKAIAKSKLVQTLLFMWSSYIIMESQLNGSFEGFWCLKPENTGRESQEINMESSFNECGHRDVTCKQNIISSMKNYAILGLTLDLIKTLMSSKSPNANGFFLKVFEKLKAFRFQTTPFLVSYVGIYKFMNCYLNSRSVKFSSSSLTNHKLSSFLAGLCFIFYSKMTLLSYALTVSLDHIWKQWRSQSNDKENEMIKKLKQIPFDKILYPILLGHVVNLYVIKPKYISSMGATVFNGITNDYALHFMKTLLLVGKKIEGKL